MNNILEVLYEEQTKIINIIFTHLNNANRDFIFVGGTAINRVLFKKPYRFSKDIDIFVFGIEELNYLDELYGDNNNYQSLKNKLENINTTFEPSGHTVGLTFLRNSIIDEEIKDDFFIEYQVEASFQNSIIYLEDFKLNKKVKTLSPLDFLNNKLIKLRDRVREGLIQELVKDMIDSYMIFQTFQVYNKYSKEMCTELVENIEILESHFQESFEIESKKYLFDTTIVPTNFKEIKKMLHFISNS